MSWTFSIARLPPRMVGSVGCVREGKDVRAANPWAHAGRMLRRSRAYGSASQGLGRCLLTLKAPLRETVGGWDESGNGTGREEREIASRTPPHGNVEADIHVEKPPSINQAWHKLGLPQCSCIGEIMAIA
jgi:hypothetical protein